VRTASWCDVVDGQADRADLLDALDAGASQGSNLLQ
jgi:hypothetical protein